MENFITVKANTKNVESIVRFAEKWMQNENIPRSVFNAISVSIDEIFSNIVNYGYKHQDADVKVTFSIENHENGQKAITLLFADKANAFNPLSISSPDVKAKAKDRQIGGLGFFMVRNLMDEVRYSYKDDTNFLSISKIF